MRFPGISASRPSPRGRIILVAIQRPFRRSSQAVTDGDVSATALRQRPLTIR